MTDEAPSPEELPPLTGVAALADRPVDGRPVARVMAIVALCLAAGCVVAAELLLEGASAMPDGAERMQALANDGPTPTRPPTRLALVLVDGLRVDEARALPSWVRMRDTATTGTVRVALPSLSRPFHHHLFTGVPADVSGVRTNRFDGHARFDSVMDRVRAAGGRVFIVAEGLDWMRVMHGREGDGGSDAPDAMGAPLDEALAAWREAPAPALLVVHFVDTDTTAHHDGVRTEAHRRALATADAVIERVSTADAETGFVLVSDHGHRDAGGHGGDEPEVVNVPLLMRVPGVTHGEQVPVPIDPDALAPSIALALGVSRPRTTAGASLDVLAGPGPADEWPLHGGAVAHAVRERAFDALSSRRHWAMPIVLFLAFALLGPIKRAFRFDRSMVVAGSVPFVVIGLHLTFAPLTLSAIDERALHVARVVGLGAGVALLAIVTGRAIAGGAPADRLRRAAATAGWASMSAVLVALAGCGFGLGPWPLSARMFYLPLLACGAGFGALTVAGVALLWASRAQGPTPSGAADHAESAKAQKRRE